MDVAAIVQHMKIPPHRITILSGIDTNVRRVGTGVLVVLTVWSGPSRLMLGRLWKVLSVAPYLTIPLFVVDGDEYNDLFTQSNPIPSELSGLTLSHGNGEIYWILDGKVINSITIKDKTVKDADVTPRIEQFCRELMS